MRFRRLAASVALLILGSMAACSSTSETTPANSAVGSRITVAMVTHGRAGDPFWGLVVKGAQQAARDFNVALTYRSPTVTNPRAQATMITAAAQKKPGAMAVTIPDAPVLSPAVRQVTSSGIPVVVFNVGDRVYQQAGALTFVGQADLTGGQEAGRAMVAAGVRHALCVIHEAQNTALTDRCAGFSRQFAAGGGSVQVLYVNGSQLHQAQVAIVFQHDGKPPASGVVLRPKPTPEAGACGREQ